ncbi:helix-turn-helix transcriptional regulator [Bacillus sp. JJ1566]|uniref:helix-turn-helix domain-containing protein n=1 Tax=Bacillus sp. JJ1566 TaxID=3122961 RepID=UPI002FFFB98A
MTLAEKLKQMRKNASLSQEQLAEKLCVSRQAISKWESGRGTPDVENLQSVAKLFGVSVDSLLGDGTLSTEIIKEKIDISQYEKTGKARSKYDAVVREKYPHATAIRPLVRRKKLNRWESIIDFIVQPGVLAAADSFNDMTSYYLVELQHKRMLVNVTKEFIESQDLNGEFNGKKRVIGDNLFIKAPYTL